MFLAFKERRFAKRIIRQMLEAHSATLAENPELSGPTLYREILQRTQHIDIPDAKKILWQAEDSIDEWTAGSNDRLGFRQVVYFVVTAKYRAAGNVGSIVSFREIVYSMVPENL